MTETTPVANINGLVSFLNDQNAEELYHTFNAIRKARGRSVLYEAGFYHFIRTHPNRAAFLGEHIKGENRAHTIRNFCREINVGESKFHNYAAVFAYLEPIADEIPPTIGVDQLQKLTSIIKNKKPEERKNLLLAMCDMDRSAFDAKIADMKGAKEKDTCAHDGEVWHKEFCKQCGRFVRNVGQFE